jgi:hypothetical protein
MATANVMRIAWRQVLTDGRKRRTPTRTPMTLGTLPLTLSGGPSPTYTAQRDVPGAESPREQEVFDGWAEPRGAFVHSEWQRCDDGRLLWWSAIEWGYADEEPDPGPDFTSPRARGVRASGLVQLVDVP